MSLTPINEALDQLAPLLPLIDETESVPLSEASGRVLAEDCVSGIDVPGHCNSAMDGYAVRSTDLGAENNQLRVTQRIAAGEVGGQLDPGEAARIFTGAAVPSGADAVVMQENCETSGDALTVLQQKVQPGDNLRQAGDDIRAGTMILAQGHRLKPQDLGLLASIGLETVSVRRRLRVSLLTTGDELVQPGTELRVGQIYNSNYYTLRSLLEGLQVEVLDCGIVEDDFESTRQALVEAAAKSDCVITTGGVSVGEEDHVKAVIEQEGELQLWKLAIKPGKPLACGKIAKIQFFGLPGNPVSAFVTFVLVVRPCLLRMLGAKRLASCSYRVAAGFVAGESGERQEYLRCTLTQDAELGATAQPLRNQSSGVAASLSQADGLCIVPPYTTVSIGDSLEFIPFSELLN
ncbi:MAG: molybdopterin molybdenumtransferase MoeA [Pseudohongiella sp.]|nr:MAG: molybdopterin molybdenumtransferase MoeA [Pseudohongiella sp.]